MEIGISKNKTRKVCRIIGIAAVLLSCWLLDRPARASEPTATRPFYNHFSADDEDRLGEAISARIEREGLPIPDRDDEAKTLRIKRDSGLEAYLDRIASKLGQSSQRPEMNYSVRVLDAPTVINAFSIPGGRLYVSSGLLDFVQSESELAAVLAHEVGHIVGGHASNRIARLNVFTLVFSQARQFGLISDDDATQKLADSVVPLIFAADSRTFYSRDNEIEADLLGLYELVRSGWDPEGETALLARLSKASPAQSPLAALVATHPNSSDRLLIIQNELRAVTFPKVLKRDSPEFEAMKSAARRPMSNNLWSGPPASSGAVLALIAALLFGSALWRRTARGGVHPETQKPQ